MASISADLQQACFVQVCPLGQVRIELDVECGSHGLGVSMGDVMHLLLLHHLRLLLL